MSLPTACFLAKGKKKKQKKNLDCFHIIYLKPDKMEESGLDNLGMSKTTINHKLRVISDAEYHMYVNSAYVANW